MNKSVEEGSSEYLDIVVNEVKHRLVDYLGLHGITLTPSGHYSCFIKRNHRHGDAKPSAYISTGESGHPLWYCNLCSTGGSIYDAAASIENLDLTGRGFIETTIYLANKLGIAIDETRISTSASGKNTAKDYRLSHIYDFIASRLSEMGTGTDALTDGRFGRAYPKETAEDIVKTIPIAVVNDPVSLLNEIRNNFPDEYVNIPFIYRNDTNEWLDGTVFGPDALTYPLRLANGTIYAFMARTSEERRRNDSTIPKYKVTEGSAKLKSTNPLFLDIAKDYIRDTHTVYIVEGVFDALLMHLFGFKNTIALLGASLTQDVVTYLLKLNVWSVNMVLDSDKAGILGVKKSIELWKGTRAFLNVVPLPKDTDPDVLLSEGEVGWLDTTVDAVAYIIENDPILNDPKMPKQVQVQSVIEYITSITQFHDSFRSYAQTIGKHLGRNPNDIMEDLVAFSKGGETAMREMQTIVHSLEDARHHGIIEFDTELERAREVIRRKIGEDTTYVTNYTMTMFNKLLTNPEEALPTLIRTGFPRFDQMAKIVTSNLTVWTGYESNGKSTVLRNIAFRGFLANNADPYVFYVSTDDDTSTIMIAILAIMAEMSIDEVETMLRQGDFLSHPKIAKNRDLIYDTMQNRIAVMGLKEVSDMKTLAKRTMELRAAKPDSTMMVVVDAIQDMREIRDRNADQRLAVESIYADMIRLARETDTSVHAVNHQKADSGSLNKRPKVENIKGSSSIRYDARNIFMAHMSWKYDKETPFSWRMPGMDQSLPIVEIDMAKDKHREANIHLPFRFNPFTLRTDELDDVSYKQYEINRQSEVYGAQQAKGRDGL